MEHSLNIVADCRDSNLKNLERAIDKMNMWLEVSYKFYGTDQLLLIIKPREEELKIWEERSELDFYQYAATIVASNLIKHNH